jgi:mono/diheme cytochrome c family protein
MKKLAKLLLLLLVAIVLLLAVGITLTVGWRPFIGPKTRELTDREFQSTPARLERGARLVRVAGCYFCHSPHDYSLPDEPVISGREFSGAQLPFAGLPGRVVAPNLTPDRETGAGNWSDDQLARAIREGIGHDGRALFPMMPYQNLHQMSDEELASVIVYLRTVPAIHNQVPPTELIFPVKYLIRSAPEPLYTSVPEPDTSNKVNWGKYLLARSGCEDCHTPQAKGQRIEGMKLAGGFTLTTPGNSATSANITPDASGISYYDEALFIEVMRTGMVKARKLSPHMPTSEYKYLTDDELKAIYAYLRTIPPVKHRVDNTQPPTACKLCQGKHGAGDQN